MARRFAARLVDGNAELAAPQHLGGVAVVDALEAQDDVAFGAADAADRSLAHALDLEDPSGNEAFGIVRVRRDAQLTADAVGAADDPDHDAVGTVNRSRG